METPRQNVRTHKYSSVKAQERDGGMHLGRFAQTACFEGYFVSIQSSYPCTPHRSPVNHTFSSQIIVPPPETAGHTVHLLGTIFSCGSIPIRCTCKQDCAVCGNHLK